MNTRNIVIATLAIATLVNCSAIANAADYRETLKICGAEWRASDARKSVAKGEGQKAWNTFRAECVLRHGYDTKRGHKGNVSETKSDQT